jgi:hydroxylamine reductase (hybrid-cluster protein)
MVKKRTDLEVLEEAANRPRTKEEAKAFLRSLYKKATIEITDPKELANMMLIFKLMEPTSESNNQHSWAETFISSKQKPEYSLSRTCTWEEIGL